MNFLLLILSALVVNGIWAQFQSKKQLVKSSVIRCTNDIQCTTFLGKGATCKDDKCVCENEDECKTNTRKIEARFKSNVIGEQCAEDFHCNIQFSVCQDSYCVCEKSRVSSIDGRKCLEVSEGLGKNCSEDSQCLKKIEGSVCRDNICKCDEIHHQVPDFLECYQKVGLGQPCTLNSQCNHILHAHCGLIHCECDTRFIESVSRSKCLPVATKPLEECEDNNQCQEIFSYGGVCMHGKCECDSVHRIANLTECPSRLKQVCIDDNECKSYTDDPTMHCEMDRCECLYPYVEEDGFCNGSSKQELPLKFIILLIVLFIY